MISEPTTTMRSTIFRPLLIIGAIYAILALTEHLITNCRSENIQIRRSLAKSGNGSGYNILVLGGRTTAGATIPLAAQNSYGNIIGKQPGNRVKIISSRDTGAGYASHCIETLVDETNKHELYDVIILEYSLSGHKGLDLLLRRLRLRYPDAIMIYIHLYSFRTDVVGPTGQTPLQMRKYDSKLAYKWGPGQKQSTEIFNEISKMMKEYNGYMYSLPHTSHVMNSLDLFNTVDWHHLSIEGHKRVAEDLLALIKSKSASYSKEKAKVGQWGEGDQCISWFTNGKEDMKLEYSGQAAVAPFEGFSGESKFALQFKGPGKIVVENKKNIIAPIFLSFMTKEKEYPKVEIKISNRTVVLDPSTNISRQLMKNALVGWAMAGRTEIEITPKTTWNLPFRVTGVNLCGACYYV